MKPLDTSTPVVVLRCARHGGLGLTRSLGRMGVPVFHIDERPSAPAFHSRYSEGRFVWDLEQALPAETVAFLGTVAKSIGRRAILVPTCDTTAMLLAGHADVLAQWFEFPRMQPGLVKALCSKREMHLLAQKHGVPTPETVFPQSRRDLLEHSLRMRFPVIAKGIFGVELERKSGKRMFLLHNHQELLALYDAHEDWSRPNIMLQEFIPGAAGSCWILNAYYDRDSRPVAEFTGRKIRQYPAYRGLTSLGECVRNDDVATISRDFVKACGYQGILDIDYIYDARDGQYKILDINPRIGATFRLFAGANGMDVARALYLDLTGQPVECDVPREGRKWVVEDCDLISSLRYLWDGKIGPGDWIRSYRGVEEAGVFAMDDPFPALWMGLQGLRKSVIARESGGRAGSDATDRPVWEDADSSRDAHPVLRS